MRIAAFQPESFVDYPGKISALVFSPECNYKCPGCHAKKILTSKERVSAEGFFDYLNSRKNWIDAVVLCGGEPTLETGLIDFIKKIKEKGFLVKLDTNGSNPEILAELLEKNLIDYVALDIKAPKELYPVVAGVNESFISLIEHSIKLVTRFPDYEFRTTIFPVIRQNNVSFMTLKEVEDIAKWIVETTGNNNHKYFLQRFVARSKEEMLTEKLSKENIPGLKETPEDLLKEMHKKAIKHLPKTKIR